MSTGARSVKRPGQVWRVREPHKRHQKQRFSLPDLAPNSNCSGRWRQQPPPVEQAFATAAPFRPKAPVASNRGPSAPHQGKALNIVGRSLSSAFDPPAKPTNEMPGEMFQVRNSRLVAHRMRDAIDHRGIVGRRLRAGDRLRHRPTACSSRGGPLTFPGSHCASPAVEAGNAPHSELPPRFNGLEYIAMVVRELVSPVRFQKLRTQIFRQHHPVRPARAHALGWSRRSATRALSQIPSRRRASVGKPADR